ncbi:mating type [Aspergillus sp. HF37]|nr:mating type [Aspergillus sp. HF37]
MIMPKQGTFLSLCSDISIILGKQWKDEPDDIKAQYKAQAEELKRQHARDHPDYQYTPRKPSEKKRRASSRQHPRHASMLRAGGSPTSTTSNASTPVLPPGFQQGGHGQGRGNAAGDMQTPMSMPMQMQMQMRGDGGGGMNVVLGPNDPVSEQAFGLDAEAFSALVQQVNNGGDAGRVEAGGSASGGSNGGDSRFWMYQGLNSVAGAEQAAADSFEFSDFITDFY